MDEYKCGTINQQIKRDAITFETGACIGREDNGHMCFVVLQAKYREIIMDKTWT